MLARTQGTSLQLRGVVSYSKATRMGQVEQQIAEFQILNKKGLSMRQIARRLGMSASGHLMSILWDMAETHRLVAIPRPYRDGMTAWEFKLPPDRLSIVWDSIYGDKSAPTMKRSRG
jgi:hypothetical protein